MIGIRSTLSACNCMNRLYDRGIYRRINTELPSSVNDVPIDEVNLGGIGSTSIFSGRTPLASATERASSYVLQNNSRPSGRSMYARIVRPAIAPIVVTEQLSRSLDQTAP